MKILTPEEEKAHYNAVLKGGIVGGIGGLGFGAAAVWAATKRFPAFAGLTVPFRVFLVTGAATFVSVISADRASTAYELKRNPERRQYIDRTQSTRAEAESAKGGLTRAKDWATENRYSIVFGSWIASMGVAGAIVSRNRYLSGSQKLVQARMYAQGLTIAVLLASFALETSDMNAGRGRWETVKVIDPEDPEHKRMIEKRVHHEAYAGQDQWRDMIEAEERRMKEREEARRTREKVMGAHKEDKQKEKHDDEAQAKEEKPRKKGKTEA